MYLKDHKKRRFQGSLFFLSCLMLLLATESIRAATVKNTGFIDVNLYPYFERINSDNSITLNIASSVTDRLSYFSLNNFGDQEDASKLRDVDSFYSEQNLRWKLSPDSPVDLTMQLNFRSGSDNDRYRLGVRWRLQDTSALTSLLASLHMKYSINLHAFQSDHERGNVWQIEHVFRIDFPQFGHRIYIAGFADHTFNQYLPANIPDNPIVAETQLGYRLANNFHLIAEFRVNQYRRSSVNNVALGFEYKFKW